MSDNIFLQETTATVAFFDVRQFSKLTADLSPTDLAVALGGFYRTVEGYVREHGGRVVKFISDAALTLFPAVGGADHAGDALRMVQTVVQKTPAWLQERRDYGLPALDFSVGVASGPVLYGALGTKHLRAFDALGQPVTLATRLSRLATARGVPNLVAGSAREAMQADDVPCVEVESAEFAGDPVRLFRVLGPQGAQDSPPAQEGGD